MIFIFFCLRSKWKLNSGVCRLRRLRDCHGVRRCRGRDVAAFDCCTCAVNSVNCYLSRGGCGPLLRLWRRGSRMWMHLTDRQLCPLCLQNVESRTVSELVCVTKIWSLCLSHCTASVARVAFHRVLDLSVVKYLRDEHSRDSDKASGWTDRSSNLGQRDFLFARASKSALGPTQPPIQLVSWFLRWWFTCI